jgi:hypothetical protein
MVSIDFRAASVVDSSRVEARYRGIASRTNVAVYALFKMPLRGHT